MTREEADAFCRLVTAAETMDVILRIRQEKGMYPSDAQFAEFTHNIDLANDFLVRAGVLCPSCFGGGRLYDGPENPPIKCVTCNGAGKLQQYV